jgi:hypothetical protein
MSRVAMSIHACCAAFRRVARDVPRALAVAHDPDALRPFLRDGADVLRATSGGKGIAHPSGYTAGTADAL